MTPILKHMGISRNALDWNRFSTTISLIIVLMTATSPFNAPPNVRKKTAWRNDLENPKPRLDTQVPNSPIASTIFLPTFSESANLPHNIAVQNCAAVKEPCSRPIWLEMEESGRDGSKERNW